jgi:MFS family permease
MRLPPEPGESPSGRTAAPGSADAPTEVVHRSEPPPYEVRSAVGGVGRAIGHKIENVFGGRARTHVIVVLGGVLALSSADTATVGASATPLRHALHISNSDLGLLVGVNCVVAAIASLPFGVLADRIKRTTTLGISVFIWGGCMVWSAFVGSFGHLIVSRLFLGIATASAGPVIASMLGDWFPGAERGKIYSYVLTGELLGGGVGFAITGDISALSWRLSFIILALPAFWLAVLVLKLPEPVRGGGGTIPEGAWEIPRSSIAHDEEVFEADPTEVPEHSVVERPVVERSVVEQNVAHDVSRDKGVAPDPEQVLHGDPKRMGFVEATKYVLSIRTNTAMIVAGAFGYFYLTGVQTFGAELVHNQYGVNQALANLLILVLGLGAVLGVILGGRIGDSMLRRGFLNSRVFVAAIASAIAAGAFFPALLTHHALGALPWLVLAAFGLSAQNPPLNAARLDIMPAALWGRAEGVRTFLRTSAQALAPVLFGAMSDHIFGGGKEALRSTFLVMLIPLVISTLYLFRAMRTYPRDVATAAAAVD